MSLFHWSRRETIEAKNNNGWTALFAAARNGKADVIKLLLQDGADIRSKDNNGRSLLHITARFGQFELIDTFCQAGFDHALELAVQDKQGCLPLHHAAGSGSVRMLKRVLSDTVAIDARDEAGLSCHHST